jgi:hypothetical protein
MFSNETYIIMSYPNETSIAEKFESVIVKGENNTRGRDFYDLYMLMNLDGINIDDELLVKAIMNTFTKRGSSNHLKSLVEIIKTIETSDRLKAVWSNYQEQYYYAQNITYTQIIDSLKIIVNLVIKINEQ